MKIINRRMIWPILIGALALVILFLFGTLMGTVSTEYYLLAERMYQLNQDAGQLDSQTVSNSLALMEILFLSVVLFGAGMASVLLSGPAAARSRDWRMSLIPAAIMAAGIDLYIFANWIQNVQLYMSGGTINGRPFEPPILPMILLIMAIATIICIVSALIGGWLGSRQEHASQT